MAIGGWIGSIVSSAVNTGKHVAGNWVTSITGYTVIGVITGVCLVLLLEVLLKGMGLFRKKIKPNTKKWHSWLALATPSIIAAAGVPMFSNLDAFAVGGLATTSTVALCVGLWLYMHNEFPKFRTFLFFIAGLALAGIVGSFVGHAVDAGKRVANGWLTSATGFTVSGVLTAVCLVILLEVVLKGMGLFKKKVKPNTKKWHSWLALATPSIIAAAGVPLFLNIVHALATTVG
jgi:O-antigen/teichoic acid export membrane protein